MRDGIDYMGRIMKGRRSIRNFASAWHCDKESADNLVTH